jgi:hypothetical protein
LDIAAVVGQCLARQQEEHTLRAMETAATRATAVSLHAEAEESLMRRCRLTVSKPELKARLVSGLETKM